MVATAGGETPGTHSHRPGARPAPRPQASRDIWSSSREDAALTGVSSLNSPSAPRAASRVFFGSEVLITRRATVDDVARGCVGCLVVATLPDQGSDMATMAAASAFGAQMQARGVCAISPVGMAARHRFSQIEAGVTLPPPAAAVAAGYGRQLLWRADVLAVLCLPGWDDCQRVAADIADALLRSRRVFMVSC